MCKRVLFAAAMVFVSALAFTGPAMSEQDLQTELHSSQL